MTAESRIAFERTAGQFAVDLRDATVEHLEAAAAAHLPGWRIPRTFAGHQVGGDVRADVCFTLHHLATAGIDHVGGVAIDDVLTSLLADIDGAATHSFFSYRIAETLFAHGPFANNPLLNGFSDAQVEQVALAVDSSDWLELLDAGVLPRNYAGVLARCELGRVNLGLVDNTSRLDELVARVAEVVGDNPRGVLDDSNDRVGRYDIYSADVWLFAEPLADRLGDVWSIGIERALDLVKAVGTKDGSAVPWGRSTGDLAVALTLELAAFALARPKPTELGWQNAPRGTDSHPTSGGSGGGDAGLWLRRAMDATNSLSDSFDIDGLSRAHRYRAQDSYRGPERRLQMTFDLLGKMAWAAAALLNADPGLTPASAATAYPADDQLIRFEDDRATGVWTHRSAGARFVVPFVGASRSHYLPVLHEPGAWEVPVDRDLPTWTPLVLDRLKRFCAGGLPAELDHRPNGLSARWDSFVRSGVGLEGDDAADQLAGQRTMDLSVEGRTVVLTDELSFDRAPVAVSMTIPETVDRPLNVQWSVAGDAVGGDAGAGECDGAQATTIEVAGLSEWRSSWSEIERIHQLDLVPDTHLSYTARVTPLMRVGSTAFGHHYHDALYPHMTKRVVGRRAPIGWDAVDDPAFRSLDVLHLHWPEWVAFDRLDAHQKAIARLADADIPVVWTAHNLTPHEKRPDVYDPIYSAWAASVGAVIHHSAWGEARIRERYRFGDHCQHAVIPHGHFGTTWTKAGLPDRAEAEQRLNLKPAKLRIGIVGAPRTEKLTQAVLDGVAACERDDLELVCWSLKGDEIVPDDRRIAEAERYRSVDPGVYATRLAACDVLALVFDEDGDMLTTGAAGDAIGLGLPTLRSDWGYLTEHLGDAGIAVGQTAESIAAALDALTDTDLDAARTAALSRRDDLEWSALAGPTADLFESVILQRGPR